MYLAHRWLMQVNWSRPVLGPESIRDLERTVSGLVELPLSDREKIMLVSLVDAYVTGSVRQEIQYDSAAADSGMTDAEFWNHQLPFLNRAMESGRFPTMAAMSANSFDVFSGGWEESFQMGLRFVLDGLEQEVERRGLTAG